MSEGFAPNDQVLLIDRRGRRYLIRLTPAMAFHYHRGIVQHDDLVGLQPGSWIKSTGGGDLVALRPRLMDYVLKMKRGPQVVYPKDVGPILVNADIRPGSVVLEAGTGSGALTLSLIQAVGPNGRVVSVETRPDHAVVGRRTIENWFGEVPDNLELVIGEVEDVIERVKPNRVVLDLPEPWNVVEGAARHLTADGILCAYLPTVPQVEATVAALRGSRKFFEIEVQETLFRTWNVDGRSVRPSHRMVGHTGFLVIARLVAGRHLEDGNEA